MKVFIISYVCGSHKVEITLKGESGLAVFNEFIKGLSGKVDCLSFSIHKHSGLPLSELNTKVA